MRKRLIPLLILPLLALSACGSAEHKYTITIDSDVMTGSISLGTDGGVSTGGGATVPYTNSIELPAGHALSVTAQADVDASWISCKITDETGRVLVTNRSSGGYAFVSCMVNTGL